MLKSFFTFKKVGGGFTNDNAGMRKQSQREEEEEKEEDKEYTRFLTSSVGEYIREELERLEERCKSSTHMFPCSTDTGLERAVLLLLHTELTGITLPVRLIELLLQRLRMGCATFSETELAHFLQDSLPTMCALAALTSSKMGVTLLDLGLDEHLFLVMQFVSSTLMSQTMMEAMGATAPVSNMVSSSEDIGDNTSEEKLSCDLNSSLPHDVVLRTLRDVLQLLVIIHVTPMQTTISATGIPPNIIAGGLTCYRQDNISTMLLETLHPDLSPSDTTVGVNSGGNVSASRIGILTECVRLFLNCSKGAFDINLLNEDEKEKEKEKKKEQERGQMISEVLCSLALLIRHLFCKSDERMICDLLAGVSVQHARFLVACGQKTLDLMLRQMSCGLLLVTKLLRDYPLLTIHAMSAVDFFDNLVRVLQVVGVHYECALNDEGCIRARRDCLKELQFITDLETFRARKPSENVLRLSKPRFDRLADNNSANEFLHCYLGLLETQRYAKTMVEVQGDPAVLRLFTEIELTIMKAFLEASHTLMPASCMYDTLMKIVLSSLPSHEVAVVNEEYVGALMPLLNAGLYMTLFHKQAFRTFRNDSRLHYAAVYLLHYMFTRPVLSLGESLDAEVGIILEACHTVDMDKSSADDGVDELSLMCAILISALHGPNMTLIVNSILHQNGVVLFAKTANTLSSFSNTERGAEDDVCEWVMYLLTVLLRQPEIQKGVLMSNTSIFFSLLTQKNIRRETEMMIVSLLSHRCAETEYSQRMGSLVKDIWGLVGQCLKLETEGCVIDVSIRADDESHLLLSILYCIRASIDILNEDLYSWGPVRQLQNVLCGAATSTPDPFLCLLHRAVLPWHGVRTSYGLTCLLHTIALLIQGNPALRARLFRTIDAEKLVDCFKNAWFTSHGGSWMQFVRCILALIYEEDTDLLEMNNNNNSNNNTTTTSINNNSTSSSSVNIEKSPIVKKRANVVELVMEEREGSAIQNPELLLPLMSMFTKLKEFNKKHRDALEYLLLRISRTLKVSRVSLWMVANAGLFVSLTALIPVVTGTALLETVQLLIMDIASHHISVRETKQFLISIAHTKNEAMRRRFVPIVIDVLNVASRALLNCQAERHSYIAFRERSGPTGVKAILQDFPQDGYAVSMWVRMERCADWRVPQCILSLQGIEKRTVLELVITAHGISVMFQNLQRKKIDLDLKCSITPEMWSHLTVVHRQATFPFSGSEFLLFLNGVEATTVSSVQYPQLFRAFLYIGTRGENVEQRSSRGSFTGQMTSVYFFNRPLSPKEVMDLFYAAMGVSTLKQYASQVVVHVDPRFGERGQLHNLAALIRGKPSEQPLITYEGTIACNKNSIIDSICVLGALQTVVVPLLALLVTPQLPFQCRIPVARRKRVPETTREAMDHLLQLVESLLVSNIVRADVLEVGLFPMISHVLQQFVGYDCANLPQRLWNLCMALLSDNTIFDIAYTALFLSGELLQACSEKTRLMFIKIQYNMTDKNIELRQRLRTLDVPSFVVREIAYVYNTLSPHHQAMRSELFTLLEKIMVDPITMNDADAILRLIVTTVEQEKSPILLEILQRTRVFVAKRNPYLAVYMGKKNFALVLIPILQEVCTDVRNEALLFLCLLVSRSRRTQELLNPNLLTAHGTVHVECGVCLSWLRDKLQSAEMDMSLYVTLRAALTGRFDVSLKECIDLQGYDKIVFVPALTPLLQLMNWSQDETMKSKAMMDLSTLVQQDSSAWKSIVSVPGWYASIVDLYFSEDDSEDEKTHVKTLFLTSTTTVLVKTIFQALLHESYGASELELLVAFLARHRAHKLLNTVLMGVVKEYGTLFASRRHMFGGAQLGLGSQHAATNFAAFVFVIEDVLFYSVSTYQKSLASRSTEPQRKRGYTEEDELILCAAGRSAHEHHHHHQYEQKEEQQQLDEAPIFGLFFGDEAMQYRIAPDGVWLHAPLAIHTMHLITTHISVLNFGCAGNSSGGLDFYTRERRGRKGGFLRFFVRLFRVVCNFTLRDVDQVDGILSLSERWVQLIQNEQGIFGMLRRQLPEQKEHSPFSVCMIMILSLHELLLRRLRFSVQGPSTHFADANSEILDRIKSLCVLYKRTLSQLQIFYMNSPSDESASRTRMNTLDWLSCKSRESSIAEFVEVASRQDYDSFIRHCTLIMERDQLTEKGMVWNIEQEHTKIMTQLHQVITHLNVARKVMLDALEQHLQTAAIEKVENNVHMERYAPQAVRTLAIEVFNRVWIRFLERCKGTIWDFDPAGQRSTKYIRLLEVEQQRLIRRKFIFDFNGTNHANVTPMGATVSTDHPVGKQHFCLRGGEQVLLLSPSAEDDDNDEEDEEVEDDTEEKEPGTIATLLMPMTPKSEVHFSMTCEVPYMMHCWSATFMIREGDICVFFDDENTSYNQRIVEETKLLLIKPTSILYPSDHVVMLAPGRRFRMQRTGIELWFLDGRSVLINFFSVSNMRIAAKSIRNVANRRKVTHIPFCILHENPKRESLLLRFMEQWRDREMSNFDYLLWLNFFAGRTLNDLTQYPVFPWVIADYTSEQLDLENSSTFRDFTLPIGICGGPNYRMRVEMRYEEMKQIGDVPAHYFTHYSSPAVVLYYLIRVEPFTTLHIILQGGHFDHADRMFHSIAACWRGVTTNSQDVRELIPELFYMPELCTNTNQVRFGCKQGGEHMDSLELPPWAHNNPYEFIYCMREALESDYVSSRLHHWIDLIFGYKQRGKEAIAALNVFNWHSYEELDKNLSNDVDKQLLIDSLDNIGQTPIQLFTRGHVKRRLQNFVDPVTCSISIRRIDISHMCSRVARLAVLASDRVLVVGGSGTILLFKFSIAPVMRRVQRTLESISVSSPVDTPVLSAAALTGGDTSTLSAGTMTIGTSLQAPTRSSTGGGARVLPIVDIMEDFERRTVPLPPGVVPNTSNKAGGPCETENVAVLSLDNELFVAFGGLFDNTFMIIPLNSTFSEERLSAHRGRVVCIAASSDSQYLVSGAEDTTFIVWSCHLQHGRGKIQVHLLFTVYGHEDNPTAVDLSPALDLVVTASRDGVLMLHSLMGGRLERSLRHPEKFTIDRVLIQATCYLPNILYVSAVDHVIHQISVNGVELRSIIAPGRITGWCITPRQHILITTAPLTQSNASVEFNGAIHFVHAFYLSVLKSFACPLQSLGSTLTFCSVHPLNSQVIVCGSSEGSLLLLRLEP